MRKISFLRLMFPLSVFTIGLFCPVPANPQERDFGELARRVLTTSVSVKPGDVVVISGGKHTIPLMEALAIEAQKAGGLVTMFLASDKLTRSRYMDAPEDYLAQEPRYVAEWLKQVDVWINLPEASDIKALQAGVSAARLAKIDKANQFILPLLDGMKFREADLILPTEERARSFGLDPATYINMVWGAIGADYQQISVKGNELKKVLQGAKTVRITSPSGTNLTFAVGNRPIFVDDGIVSAEKAKSKRFLDRIAGLPGGNLNVAPLENSATGKVVVPRAGCRFEPMTDVSFTFQNGKMENFKAGGGGQCFQELISSSAGPTNVIASFGIGLNPTFKVHEENGAVYYPGSAAGLVFVGIGDNQVFGGNNKTQGNFGFVFPIVKATVEIDGQVVVKDGQLAL